MNDCPRLDDLLEADLETLSGAAASVLSEHIRDCEVCARAAGDILGATRRLDAAISGAGGLAGAPPLDVEAVLARARISGPIDATPPTRGRKPLARIAVLAAAAALAGVMVVGERERTGGDVVGFTTPPGAEVHPLVEPAAGQDIAVIPTRDPDITIVWIFQGE